VEGESVSDGFFQTLGVVPLLGREFRAGEDLPSAQRTVMLSYAAWQKRFAGKSDAVGRTIDLDGDDTLIIGVLPKDFHFAPAEPADFWGIIHEDQDCRACHSAYAIGRLKDGVGLQAASAQMKLIAKQIEKQNPDTNRDRGAYLLPLTDLIVGDVRPILLLLLSGAGLLILIACVNVSSLLLVRAESRKREIAVRGALGASPARLMRQFVTEGLLLALAGVILGTASAYGLMRLLVQLIPTDILTSMPYLQDLGINLRVLTFACVLGLLAAVLFSLTPILRLKLSDLRDGLADGGRGSAGTMWRRFGANLVILELATAMVLLVGAALLGQSFYRLLHVDPGLNPDHVAIMRVGIEGYGAVNDKNFVPFMRNFIDRLSNLPGVKSVGVTSHLPVGDGDDMMEFVVVGRPDPGLNNEVTDRHVSAGYFATLQTRLLRGRFFTDSDDESKPHVTIINHAFAKKYFPDQDPIGRRINRRGAAAADSMQIIGVLDDLREGPLDLAPAPATYEPFNQGGYSDFSLVLRTSQDEQTLFPAITATVHSISPSLTAHHPLTMEERIQDSPTAYLHRASAWIVGGFAALALLLGVVGLYGVIAYSVSQRTREIGVRMALGAQRRAVYRLILGEAGLLTVLGIGAGLLCSLAATVLMRKLLFGVTAWDIPTLLAVAATLAVASMLASYIPARRAAAVHPTEALRAE
jgi:macrolide transport system ATP-binding/permease protein